MGGHALVTSGLLVVSLGCGGSGGGGEGGTGAAGGHSTGTTGVPGPPPANPKAACEQYIGCLKVVSPSAAGEALAMYGDSGSCWEMSFEDQQVCGDVCVAELTKKHSQYDYYDECALCSRDEGCLDPEARRCSGAGTAEATCGECAKDEHCTEPDTSCQKGGCWPNQCKDRTASKQLLEFLCSAACDPIFCDAESVDFTEEFAWHLGCHAEYLALVDCQIHAPGSDGCSVLGPACVSKYSALSACEDVSIDNGIRGCP